jgi:hypothetical protein
MKNKEKLSHSEIMEGLTYCFRELIETEVSHRNMPNIINRGKAVAAIVTASHREELMEAKRESGLISIKAAEKPSLKKLKYVKEPVGTSQIY